MIEAILLAWKAASWGMRIVAVVGPLIVVGTAYGVWHHKVYQQGVSDTIAGIAREDSRWINRAIEARNKWKDCRDQGHEWDQSTGRCL